jgi:hypothetical protein
VGGYLRGQDKDKQDKNLSEIIRFIDETLNDFDLGRDRNSSLRFKFHSGASLLVVSGSPGEVDVARKVILALPETSSSKAQPSSNEDAARARFLQRYGINPAPAPQPAPAADTVVPVAPPTPKR